MRKVEKFSVFVKSQSELEISDGCFHCSRQVVKSSWRGLLLFRLSNIFGMYLFQHIPLFHTKTNRLVDFLARLVFARPANGFRRIVYELAGKRALFALPEFVLPKLSEDTQDLFVRDFVFSLPHSKRGPILGKEEDGFSEFAPSFAVQVFFAWFSPFPRSYFHDTLASRFIKRPADVFSYSSEAHWPSPSLAVVKESLTTMPIDTQQSTPVFH